MAFLISFRGILLCCSGVDAYSVVEFESAVLAVFVSHSFAGAAIEQLREDDGGSSIRVVQMGGARVRCSIRFLLDRPWFATINPIDTDSAMNEINITMVNGRSRITPYVISFGLPCILGLFQCFFLYLLLMRSYILALHLKGMKLEQSYLLVSSLQVERYCQKLH